ncbi:hypothetical protein D3C76_1290420 [compost metagenome]
MRFSQILPRADGNNARRINGFVAAVIVVTDVVKIDRLRNSRHLIDVAQETVQVEVIADPAFVALKVGHVNRIEANQSGPQANIGFGQLVTGQIAVLTQDLLQTLQ